MRITPKCSVFAHAIAACWANVTNRSDGTT